MRYNIDHYWKSGSQAIHIQKIFACIGLQHVELSSKRTCRQLEICLYSPPSTNRMNFQSERNQCQAWSKDALVFSVQEMYLVSACIWNMRTSNTVHNSDCSFKPGQWTVSLALSLHLLRSECPLCKRVSVAWCVLWGWQYICPSRLSHLPLSALPWRFNRIESCFELLWWYLAIHPLLCAWVKQTHHLLGLQFLLLVHCHF